MRKYLAVLLCVTASPAWAQNVEVKCKPKGNTLTEVTAQAAYNDFELADSVATSLSVSERICARSIPIQWTITGAVDRVVTDGEVTTAGRVGGGVLYRAYDEAAEKTGLGQSIYLGANAYFGYEDYSLALLTPTGGITRRRGHRTTKIVEAVAAYTLVNSDRIRKFPPTFGAMRIEARAAYIDKRAPVQNIPVRLNEGFADASIALGIEQRIRNSGGGQNAKLEYRVSYERFFTDRLAIKGFASFRLQYRPQNNPEVRYPDRYAVSLAFSVGRKYRGLNLSLSKAF